MSSNNHPSETPSKEEVMPDFTDADWKQMLLQMLPMSQMATIKTMSDSDEDKNPETKRK